MAAQKKPSAQKKKTAPRRAPAHHRETGALVCFFLFLFTFLHLVGVRAFFLNIVSDGVRGLLGYGFFLFPFAMLLASVSLLFHRGRPVRLRLWSLLLLPFILGAVCHLLLYKGEPAAFFAQVSALWQTGLAMQSGGVLAGLTALGLKAAISAIGGLIVLFIAAFLLVLAALRLSPVRVFDLLLQKWRARPAPVRAEAAPANDRISARTPVETAVGKPPKRPSAKAIDIPLGPEWDNKPEPPTEEPLLRPRPSHVRTPAEALAEQPEEAASFPIEDTAPVSQPSDEPPAPSVPDSPPWTPATKAATTAVKEKKTPPKPVAPSAASLPTGGDGIYQFPPVTLLHGAKPGHTIDGTVELKTNASRLLETLKSFGIDTRIVSVTRGPTVTRYEIELDKGIKLSRLTGLSDDIALSLGASGVRIAPVPDKMSVVGIEVPNKLVSIVYIRDVIDSTEFAGQKSKLTFAIGKDISGANIVGDIAKLTHLLIAGTTGSGKSVCMNSLIVSLLYKASPQEVRLIMIDPKMVELGIYNGIPHLEVPVVTDPKKAAGALQWAVFQMEKRYRLFMEKGVRDIFSYNQAIAGDPDTAPMPQIVIVIDELADLMLVAAKEVEESICRIAQKARAAGMHLIIATQRPSADVITGLMKANIPSRIAFAVASQLESRIILDTMGAEKLVGRGDMLLYPLGYPKPVRVQGTLISGEEVEAVVTHIKQTAAAEYSEEVASFIDKQAETMGKKGAAAGFEAPEPGGEEDHLLMTAIEVVMESGQASVSFLQRRLKLGFARAARLVDQMEERGIVGPSEGSKPRPLLITRQQWQEIQHRRGDE